MYAIFVLLFDGLGDRAYPELGGRSASEAASTPNLDAFAARGSCGLLWPLGPGRAPSSELAHWALLGYPREAFPGRALLEALGWGQEVDRADVLAYASLRPAERREGALWLTGRPRPEDEDDARELVASGERMEVGGLGFTLSYLHKGEAILRVSGGAHEAVTDTDSFFRERHPVLAPRALVPGAQATAEAAELWSRLTVRELRRHRVNTLRQKRGKRALNVITLKWWGRAPLPLPSFLELHGVDGAILGGSPFLAGLARTLGLEFVEAPETDDAGADLVRRLEAAAELFRKGATFVLSHQKAADEAGHTKDPLARVLVLEALDGPAARLAEAPFCDCVVCVTGDHATPAAPDVIHSGDPVPFIVAGPGVRADRVQRFGELECAGGLLGHLRGEDVMPVLLNAADRPLFLGSRPTPAPGAAGFPAEVDALDA